MTVLTSGVIAVCSVAWVVGNAMGRDEVYQVWSGGVSLVEGAAYAVRLI